MKKIESAETELVAGKLQDDSPDSRSDYNKKLFGLASSKFTVNQDVLGRINWLTDHVLVLIGIEKVGGWEKLYRDPQDGRYWLLTYPFGELQGGGPPSLICKQFSESEVKLGFLSPSEWDVHMKQFTRDRNIRFISSKNPEEEK